MISKCRNEFKPFFIGYASLITTSKQNYHVTKTDKGWQLKKEGAVRATLTGKTQSDVVNEARKKLKGKDAELFIHKADGKIRDRSSYGYDPYPPQG